MNDAELRDALLREEFAFFLRYAFMEVLPGTRYTHGWHLDAIAYQLDRIRRGNTKRLIVTMPPRHLKSFAITTAWVAWMLGKDPGLRFICVSYGQDLADKHARDCLQIMSTAWYRSAFPKTALARRSVGDFETTRGGGRLSTSLGGVLTGRGGDIIVIDDPMKADDVLSESRRTDARTWLFNSLMSRLNNQESGAIVLVMQRLHCADLAGELLDLGGWEELRLAAIATADEKVAIADGQFASRKTGEALHPALLSVPTLERIKAQDSYVFAAQYQQTPVPEQGNFIDPTWFKYYDDEPPPGLVTQSWDTASKEGIFNDYSVGITAVWAGQRWYILDVVRERMNFVKLRQRVEQTCERFRVERLLIEDAASGTQLIQLLRQDCPPFVPLPIPCRSLGDKRARFSAQASRVQAGEVLLPRSAPWLAEFVAELVGFPNARHDDQADAFAQLLNNPPPGEDGPPVGCEVIEARLFEDFDDEEDDDAYLY